MPKHIEIAPNLPREDSGKIFKRRLRDPCWERAGGGFSSQEEDFVEVIPAPERAPPDGQITSFYQKRRRPMSSPPAKNILLPLFRIIWFVLRHPGSAKRGGRVVTDVEAGGDGR